MKRLSILLSVLIIAGGCSFPSQKPMGEPPSSLQTAESSNPSRLPPVETQPANTEYAPAFEGQTRVGGVKTTAKLDVSILTEELRSPWGLVAGPDGSLYITEKEGALRIMSPQGVLSKPILGFPKLASEGQGGLLDLALSPDFAVDRTIYFSFSEKSPEGSVTAVGYGILSADQSTLEEFQTVYRALPVYEVNHHFGSRVVFSSDGTLFVSTGDRQSDQTRMMAQTLDNGYGKVLHIQRDGTPAGDYFPENQEALKEVFTYGHRNVQGMAFHPQTGDLWISEMGPRGGDELNLLLAGKNYGWPVVSYGIEYSGERVLEGITQKEGTEQPVYYWDPVLAPSGMAFYDAQQIPEWENNLFIAGLRGSHIARLVLADRRVIGEERLLEEEGERFRDVAMGADGALYAITDSGKLYRIAPASTGE